VVYIVTLFVVLHQFMEIVLTCCLNSYIMCGVIGLRIEGTASSWRLAANILNKQPRAKDKGWSSSLGVGNEANNPSP
jgi:hypothetical protein